MRFSIKQAIQTGRDLYLTGFPPYVVFFVTSRCNARCKMCFYWQQIDKAASQKELSLEEIKNISSQVPAFYSLAISGGEPFCQPAPLADIARAVHAAGLDVVVYSGYTLEQLVRMTEADPAIVDLLSQVDLLIDGPFIQAERDLTLPFRGSRNQRILSQGEIRQVLFRY